MSRPSSSPASAGCHPAAAGEAFASDFDPVEDEEESPPEDELEDPPEEPLDDAPDDSLPVVRESVR
jgi:hypothetical protein